MSPKSSEHGQPRGCNFCKHLQPGALFTTCAAFPDGIPALFANGETVHDRAFPGDHGIHFEPRKPIATDHERRREAMARVRPSPTEIRVLDDGSIIVRGVVVRPGETAFGMTYEELMDRTKNPRRRP